MKRRLAVILMADMVDYTAAMEADQAGTIGLIRELRERWLEPEAETRGGEVMKRMGDGWIFAFASVTDAVETAQTVQTALVGHDKIRLRIAAHLGEIVEDEADLYGTGINIAARLQTEAPPGGLMISEDLHRQLDTRLAEGFGDAGAFTLKNIAHPVTGFQWRPSAGPQRATDDVPMIAVEPVTISPDTIETRDAAADLQDQLVHRLARRTGVRVLALDRDGLDGSVTPTYLLRSRLRAQGPTARLSVALTVRATGAVSWSSVYEGATAELFDLCDRFAGRTDIELRRVINALDGERLEHLPDDALSAGELRARAAQLFYTTTIEGYEQAVTLLERGLRLTPDNPMCKSMWAHAKLYLALGRFRDLDPDTAALVMARANEAAQDAPRSDWCILLRSQVRLCIERDLVGARRDLDRAHRINPGFPLSIFWSCLLALAEGRFDRGASDLPALYPSLENEPFRPSFAYALAVGALLDGRYDDALDYLVDAIELRPSCRAFRRLLAEVHMGLGDEGKAADALATADELSGAPDLIAPLLVLPPAHAALMERLRPDVP